MAGHNNEFSNSTFHNTNFQTGGNNSYRGGQSEQARPNDSMAIVRASAKEDKPKALSFDPKYGKLLKYCNNDENSPLYVHSKDIMNVLLEWGVSTRVANEIIYYHVIKPMQANFRNRTYVGSYQNANDFLNKWDLNGMKLLLQSRDNATTVSQQTYGHYLHTTYISNKDAGYAALRNKFRNVGACITPVQAMAIRYECFDDDNDVDFTLENFDNLKTKFPDFYNSIGITYSYFEQQMKMKGGKSNNDSNNNDDRKTGDNNNSQSNFAAKTCWIMFSTYDCGILNFTPNSPFFVGFSKMVNNGIPPSAVFKTFWRNSGSLNYNDINNNLGNLIDDIAVTCFDKYNGSNNNINSNNNNYRNNIIELMDFAKSRGIDARPQIIIALFDCCNEKKDATEAVIADNTFSCLDCVQYLGEMISNKIWDQPSDKLVKTLNQLSFDDNGSKNKNSKK